jgi:hypothetical protein
MQPPPPGPGYNNNTWDGFPNTQPPQHPSLPHGPHPAHPWDLSTPPASTDECGNYGQLGQSGNPQQIIQNPERPGGREGQAGPLIGRDINQPLDGGALGEEKSIAYEDPHLPKDTIKSKSIY